MALRLGDTLLTKSFPTLVKTGSFTRLSCPKIFITSESVRDLSPRSNAPPRPSTRFGGSPPDLGRSRRGNTRGRAPCPSSATHCLPEALPHDRPCCHHRLARTT